MKLHEVEVGSLVLLSGIAWAAVFFSVGECTTVLCSIVAIGVIASNVLALAFMVYQMSRAMLLQRDKQKSVTKMLMSMVEDEE